VVEQVPPRVPRIAVSFANLVRLEAVDAPACVRRGEPIPVSLYFRTIAETSGDFRIFVHADAAVGSAPRLRADHYPNAGQGSTVQWLKDELVKDDFTIPVPANHPAKSVVLWLGLFDEDGRLDASEETGEPTVVENRYPGATVTLGECP
jgi:hypothetical protein